MRCAAERNAMCAPHALLWMRLFPTLREVEKLE